MTVVMNEDKMVCKIHNRKVVQVTELVCAGSTPCSRSSTSIESDCMLSRFVRVFKPRPNLVFKSGREAII